MWDLYKKAQTPYEWHNDIFNLELTPNRGDCLSVNGLLRDLAVFYDVKLEKKIFMGDIKPLNIKLINNAGEDVVAYVRDMCDDRKYHSHHHHHHYTIKESMPTFWCIHEL